MFRFRSVADRPADPDEAIEDGEQRGYVPSYYSASNSVGRSTARCRKNRWIVVDFRVHVSRILAMSQGCAAIRVPIGGA